MSAESFYSDEEDVYMNIKSEEEESVDIGSLRLELEHFQQVPFFRRDGHG